MATDNAFQDILTTLPKPDGGEYGKYYSLPALNDPRIEKLPYSIRILLESAIRNCDNFQVTKNDVEKIVDWENTSPKQIEISFKPARVLLQDFTGVPAVVDLACMRDAMNKLGSDSNKINPLVPVDLVIDHSVQVDLARSENAVQSNMELEFQRNNERIGFLKWGSTAFHNMLVVPPGSGIVHQVNLEYLGRVVFNIGGIQYSDSVVGTDSHTTMIDGRGVAGWGVGGFEAETAMFGQPMSMVLPGVVGFKLTGKLRNGVTTTDFVLTVTQMLRKHGVLGKFVEFYGEDMSELSLADRATIANMPPEYGTTMGFFPVDHITLQYLKLTGRSAETVSMIEASLRAYKMFVHCSNSTHPVITAENLPGFMSVLLECISDAPNAVEKGCGAICFLAQGYEEAVQDSSLLTPYLTNIITALLLAADRTDTTTSRLRVSAYETLNEIVRCSKIPETANTSGQLLLEVMSRLNKTVDIHILSPEDREKQSDLQALQCGVLQVIIQKLSGYEETGVLQVIIQKLSGYEETKPIILQAADRMMVSLLQVFACRSSTVHEEVMLAIGALVYATGVEFAKYLLVFYKYLDMGRQNHEEYQVCFVSAGVVGDICRSLDEKVLPSCDGIMTNLLKNLSNPSLPRSVKPPIFSCFEDIALAIGKNFEDYLTYAMPILQGAAELVLHWMLLMKILLIMVINSDVESLRLLWHTPGTQEFKGPAIGALCKPSSAVTEAVCIDKDRDEAVTKATVAVMGGLAAALGPNIKILFKDPHFPYRFGGAMGGLGSIRV